MGVALMSLTVLMAVILAYTALIKLLHRQAFAEAVATWGVPREMRTPIVNFLPASELTFSGVLGMAAFGLVLDPALSCLAVCVYLLCLTMGQVWIRAHGLRADCGCFGGRRPLGVQSIAVAASLATAAGLFSVGYVL